MFGSLTVQRSFNSNTAPIYNGAIAPDPKDPDHGRQNNQGFEGLTISPDGKSLFVLLQSAARQEGGALSSKRRNTRLLKYALKQEKGGKKGGVEVSYESEFVVPLPTYVNGEDKARVAAQSEIHYISDTQLLVLARDSSAGRGQEDPLSRYRHVDIIDFSGATNIKGSKFDDIQDGNVTAGGISDPCKLFSHLEMLRSTGLTRLNCLCSRQAYCWNYTSRILLLYRLQHQLGAQQV